MKYKNVFLITICILILGSYFLYKNHFFEILMLKYNGKKNLMNNIDSFRKFKNIKTDNVYLYLDVISSDSILVNIYYPIDTIKDYSMDELENSILKSNFNNNDTSRIIEKFLGFKGNTKGLDTMDISENLKIDLIFLFKNLLHTNCKYLVGKKDDMKLYFNQSVYMKNGCITSDWYLYKYHIGVSNNYDNYTKFETGIQYCLEF